MQIRLLSRLLFLLVFTLPACVKGTDEINEVDYEIWDLMDSALKLFGPGKTWYELFGLTENTPYADIQKVYRKLSLQYHPDKNPDDPEAEKKFQTLAGIAKILKGEDTRGQYDYWLENGIPYWRGQGYYFRKSENLSVLQTSIIIIACASLMQYVIKVVRYLQINAGMTLLKQYREYAEKKNTIGDELRSKTPPNTSLKQAKKLKKIQRRRSQNELGQDDADLPWNNGLFADANIKQALEWLVNQHDINPEIAFDPREWNSMINEDFGANENFLVARFPSPFETVLFRLPVWLVGKLKSE